MGKLNLRSHSVLSHCLLNPRIGKARTGELEEDARSHRNRRRACFVLGWHSSKAAAADMLYFLVADRVDTAASHATRYPMPPAYKSFPGGAHRDDVCTVL